MFHDNEQNSCKGSSTSPVVKSEVPGMLCDYVIGIDLESVFNFTCLCYLLLGALQEHANLL